MEEYTMPGLFYEGREHATPGLTHSGGPDRVATKKAPKDWMPPPFLGFTRPHQEREPLLWEGDQA